jgi:hypothetical protein
MGNVYDQVSTPEEGQVKSAIPLAPSNFFDQFDAQSEGAATEQAQANFFDQFDPAAPKPESEAGFANQAMVGLGQTWETIKGIPDVIGTQVESESMLRRRTLLDAYAKIDAGEEINPTQIPPMLDYGTLLKYQRSNPELRQQIKDYEAKGIEQDAKDFGENLKGVVEMQEGREQYQPRVDRFTNIESLGDFRDWLGYTAGSVVPQIGATMAGAALGGTPGALLVGGAFALPEQVESRIDFIYDKVKSLPPEEKATAIQEYLNATGDVTMTVAIAQGALDRFGPVGAILRKKLAKEGGGEAVEYATKREALKGATKDVVKRQIPEEFVTEMGQEALSLGGERALGEQTGDLVTKENVFRLVDAGAAGMVGGAVGGVANVGGSVISAGGESSALSKAINDRTNEPDDSSDPADPADPADPEYIFESPEEKAARIKQEQDAKLAQQQAEKEEAAKLAAANQQNNQAQQQQAQQNQQAQTTQQLYDQFGVQPVLDPQTNQPVGKFVLGDKIFFTEGDAMAFAKGLTEAGKDLSPAQQSLVGKLFAGGVVPVKATDTAKGLVNKANRFMQDTQLASATDMNDVVSRIDQIIEAVAPKTDLVGSKMSKDAEMLTSLDKLRKSVTGEASTRLGEIADQQTMSLQQQEAQKAAKAAKGGKKNPATTATTPGNAQTSGGPNGQQQSAPGMGEVSEQGSAGGTVSPANGGVGSSQVQPVGSGSVADGSDGQQNDAGRGTGNEQRTVQRTADGAPTTGSAQDGGQEVNPVYARYSSLTPAQQKRVSDITRISQADMQSPGVVAVNERQLTAAMDKVAPDTKGAVNAGRQTKTGQRADRGATADAGGVQEAQPAGAATNSQSVQDDGRTSGDTSGEQSQQEGPPLERTKTYFRRVLEYVFVETGGNKGKSTAQKKVEFFETFFGLPASERDQTATEFAKANNLNRNTVKSWANDLAVNDDGSIAFFEKYSARFKEALASIARADGSTLDEVVAQLRSAVQVIKRIDQKEKDQEFESTETGMAADVRRELAEQSGAATNDQQINNILQVEDDGTMEGAADKNTGFSFGSPNDVSLSEENNFAEGIANKYIALREALDKAEESGDQASVDRAQKKLDEFMEVMPELEAKARRLSANLRQSEGIKKAAEAEAKEADVVVDEEQTAGNTDTNEDTEAELTQESSADDVIDKAVSELVKAKKGKKSESKPRKKAATKTKADEPNDDFAKFLETYREGSSIKSMGNNPDLRNYVEYANWLAGLTPAQIAKARAAFTKDDNPFLVGLNAMVPAASKAKIQAAIDDKPAKVEDTKDAAGQQWDRVADTMDGAPKWEDLTKSQQNTFYEFGPDNWTENDVVQELAKIQREGGTQLNNLSRLTGEPSVFGSEPTRVKSLSRGITELRKRLDNNEITPEEFAARVEKLHDQVVDEKLSKDVPSRVRGADYIRQRLLEAKRRGELSDEAVDMAEWFILKNPDLVEDLAVSVARSKRDGVAGYYNTFNRMMRLFKDADNDSTVVHEILHHLERMMPEKIQADIRRAWMASLVNARKMAQRGGNENLVKYYDALLQYHIEGKAGAMDVATKMLLDGEVGYAHYQHVNPSEFWAVNGAAIVTDRFAATSSVSGRIKQWLKELAQKLKDVFGLRSNAPIIRALDSLAKSDGEFITSRMLDGQRAGQYNMFVGTKAVKRLDESDVVSGRGKTNRVADLLAAKLMDSNGESISAVWAQTGWYKGADGKWRFEVNDKHAKIKRGFSDFDGVVRLGDYLNHPELFRAYPDLAEVKVKLLPDSDFGPIGRFNPESNTISLQRKNSAEMLSTLLHEVQHWVQDYEGFAPGDSRQLFASPQLYDSLDAIEDYLYTEDPNIPIDPVNRDFALSAMAELRRPENRKKFEKMYDEALAAFKLYKGLMNEHEDSKADMASLDGQGDTEGLRDAREKVEDLAARETQARGTYESLLSELKQESLAIDGFGTLAYYRYMMSAGETEARNTQARSSLSGRGRELISPEETADVPRRLQDVSKTSGSSSRESNEIPPAQQRKIDRNLQRVPKKARQFFGAYSKAASRLKNHLRFTVHMLDQVSKRIPAAKQLMEYIRKQNAIRSEKLFEVEKITREYDKLKKPEQDAVNSIIKRSTSSSKWAFQPSWVAQDKTKIDTALRNEYNKLSDEAKAVIRNVFAYGYNSMMEIREAVSQTIGASYDERIAQANKAGNTKLADSLKTEKETALGDYVKLFETSMNNPYAPLRRYGKHVVVYRSAEFLDADDVVRAAREGKDVSDEDLKAARKFIRDNEGDPEHYQVYFREGALEAERLADELREEFGDGVQQFTRDQAAQQMYMSSDLHGALYRLRKKANDASEEAGASEGTREALNKILSELHLTMLSEQSARHAEHKRAEGTVTGADDNMMRAFHSHGLATASMIASLNQSEKVQKAFEEFEREANSPRNPQRDKDSAIYNEVAARYAMGLDTGDTPITDTALRLNSAWMLLSKPLYYLQNSMQPWMMSAPYLAGKYGAKAYTEMLRTYLNIAPTLLANRVTKDIINKLPSDAKRVVYEMLDKGMLSISLDQDMGDRLRGKNPLDRVITMFQGAVERIEGVNRVITAVTAYRLERKAGVGHTKAIAYADEAVYISNGDYSAFNAPRIMRNQVGRVATQFRKFQLIQLGMLTKLMREAHSDINSEERVYARRGLKYLLSSVFMFGGLSAMPAFTLIAWVLGKVFGDEEEPQDLDAQLSRLRRMVGDPDIADFVVDGIPKSVFGFDGDPIFGGWANMASLVPYTKVEDTGRRTYSEIALGMAGPLIGGTVPKFFDGVGRIADGDITGGLQRILPTGAGNVIKSMELQDKGLTRKAGSEILSPDEVTEFQTFMKALGISTGDVADKEFINRVTTTYEAFYRERSQQIKQQYTEAFEKGDTRKMAEAREMWTEMNDSRRKNGFDAQPYSSLIRAPLNARKYERRVNNQLNTTGRDLAGMR